MLNNWFLGDTFQQMVKLYYYARHGLGSNPKCIFHKTTKPTKIFRLCGLVPLQGKSALYP
jgi:hypothetical protein